MFLASKIIGEGPPPNSVPLESFVSSVHTHSPSSTLICLSEMLIKPSASIYSTFFDLALEIIIVRLNLSKSQLSCLFATSPQQNGCRTFNFNPRMFSQYSLGKTWGGCEEREEQHDPTWPSYHRLRPSVRRSIVPISSTAVQSIGG
jgi:hypothetical protein